MNTSSADKALGIIGLGNMGGAFAANLVKNGFEVYGFDLDEARTKKLAENGGMPCASVTAVAEKVDHILVSVNAPAALKAIAEELAKTGKHTLKVAECGTFSLEDKEAFRAILEPKGIKVLDAPVSGTGAQAAMGDLSVYPSGDEEVAKSFEDIFLGMGKAVYYVGAFGNGIKMKLCSNLMVGIHNVAAAECLVLGMKAGLDPRLMFDTIEDGSGGSRMFSMRGPLMVEDDYSDPSATIDVYNKDIEIISEFAHSMHCPTPLFAMVKQLYDAATQAGLQKEDPAAVCRVLETLAGLKR